MTMHLTSCDICQLGPPGAELASLSLPFEKNHCPNLSQSVPYCPLSFSYGFVWLQRVPHCFMIFLFCPPTCSVAAFAESKPASNGESIRTIPKLHYLSIYALMCIFNTLIISADPCRCHCRGRRPRQRSIGSGLFFFTGRQFRRS